MTRNTSPNSQTSIFGKLFVGVLFLVILEGAIRKWFSSSLTIPLLLARDGVAIFAVFLAIARRKIHLKQPGTLALVLWSCLVIVWTSVQIFAGINTLSIAVIGLRFWLLYIWFAYVVITSMTQVDFRVSVRTVALTMILMAPLAIIQFLLPPNAFVNKQVEAGVEGIFLVELGMVRTTGTFSFTLGYTSFLVIAGSTSAMLLDLGKGAHKRDILFAILTFGAFLIGSIVSGSRAAVTFAVLIVVTYIAGSLIFSTGSRKVAAVLGAVTLLASVALSIVVFDRAIDAIQARFERSADVENIVDRVTHTFFGEPYVYDRFSALGYGVGMGSNLASYVKAGERSFTLAEYESGRILLEGGLLGILFILLKTAILFWILIASLKIAVKYRITYSLPMWSGLLISMLTWPYLGQLTANALMPIMFVFAVGSYKYPEAFRRSRTIK